ncbi:MAG: M20/M25/M40 family metallo-hydrolase, partial [Bacteroidales bacterium]|nr:M20/M25/M40 family metallo-hydrolase [Bacteroidales bacterium]
GTIRTFNNEWRKEAHLLIEQIAQNTAQAFGASCTVFIDKGYPFLYNNPALTARSIEAAQEFLGKEKTKDIDLRMTAEDFAYFAEKTPSCFYRIGVGFDEEKTYNLHASNFKLNEKAMQNAIGFMVWACISELNR